MTYVYYLLVFLLGAAAGAFTMALMNMAGKEDRLIEDRAFRIAMGRLNQRGSVVVFLVLVVPVLLVLSWLPLRGAGYVLARTEAARCADSASLGAANNLGRQIVGVADCAERQAFIPNSAEIESTAQYLLQANGCTGTVEIAGYSVKVTAYKEGLMDTQASATATAGIPAVQNGVVPCAASPEPSWNNKPWHIARLVQ